MYAAAQGHCNADRGRPRADALAAGICRELIHVGQTCAHMCYNNEEREQASTTARDRV